jgi:hypothetical protein
MTEAENAFGDFDPWRRFTAIMHPSKRANGNPEYLGGLLRADNVISFKRLNIVLLHGLSLFRIKKDHQAIAGRSAGSNGV